MTAHDPGPLTLVAGEYRLALTPLLGGSVSAFEWRGEPLFRPATGASILDVASFPLVPFSNRIAFGTFKADGRTVRLSPNFPGSEGPHPLHGFGWLSPWVIVEASKAHVRMRHHLVSEEWPWPYLAEQEFRLDGNGLMQRLRVWNLGQTPMPCGLGFHPYLPRTIGTRFHALHKGEWHTGPDGLPRSLEVQHDPIDWWSGGPVGDRTVDTVYTERRGPLTVFWPERGLSLRIVPSDNLGCTGVFVPENEDFFCIEPVSHQTDALNATSPAHAIDWLPPGRELTASVVYSATEHQQQDIIFD